jgi:hypothetical protein
MSMPSFPNELNAPALEHGSTRTSRWLQERWISIGVAIAIAEGLFIVLGELSKWPAVIVAVVLLVAWVRFGRALREPSTRIASRIVALSQALVVFVPLLIGLVYAAAIFALVALGIVALAMLFRGR